MTDPSEDLDEERPSRQVSARGMAIIGGRILVGIVGILVVGVVLAAATWLPLPSHTVSAPSMLVTPVPASQQQVCAGPLLQLGNESGTKATTVSSFGGSAVRWAATKGFVQSSSLPSTDNSSGVAPDLLTLPPAPDGSQPGLLAASQSQVADSGDNVGFAASGCAVGSGDSWLVGGSTATGRTTLVTLSNPTAVSSTASLTIYTENGPVSAAGMEGIVVPAGAQRVISLAAFAPGAQSPVVQVQSRGGSIVANLQQTTVRTLQPGGIDIVDPTTAPGTETVIPGVVIANSAGVFAEQGQPGYQDLISVVRLLAPTAASTHAEITLIPEGSTAKPAPAALVTIKGGVVTDVPLGSFPDGIYTITVTSDHPIVAATRVSTVGASGQSDFAWSAGAQPLGDNSLFVVPPGPAPTADFANTSSAAVTATLTPSTGAAVRVNVPAGSAVAVPVTSGTSYRVTSGSAVELSLSYLGDGQLAGFPVVPPASASQPIRIFR
jgi:hypothetical protein